MIFFSQQCTKVDNPSSVPENISFGTEKKRLSTFEICNDDIVKFIIISWDPNKACSHDGISISKALQIPYIDCLDNDCFPQTWKKANIVPIHKTGNKQLKKILTCLITAYF